MREATAGDNMTYDLTKFDLGDMLKCSLRLRETASGAPTLEISAQRACRFLYDELVGPDSQRACALVRCYKTHAYASLDPDLQGFARNVLGAETPRPTMKVLTLMATVGQSAGWNSRHLSRGHRAIPLPSPEIVEKAPMISADQGAWAGADSRAPADPRHRKGACRQATRRVSRRERSEVRTSPLSRSSWFASASDPCSGSEECWQPAICSPSFCSPPYTSQRVLPTDSDRWRWM